MNIKHGAEFDSGLVIGDKTSLGVDAEAFGPVRIGRNVMMEPECVILTRRHCHSRTDIPMICQGCEGYQPVTIGDDVRIGLRVIILPGVFIGDGLLLALGLWWPKMLISISLLAAYPQR